VFGFHHEWCRNTLRVDQQLEKSTTNAQSVSKLPDAIGLDSSSGIQTPCVLTQGHEGVKRIQRGYAVTQLVEALHYKPEGRGFDSR
jgi:hypothetical protein